jgi:hypothetical protein
LGRFRQKFPDVPISVSWLKSTTADIRHSQHPPDQKPESTSAESWESRKVITLNLSSPSTGRISSTRYVSSYFDADDRSNIEDLRRMKRRYKM